MDKSYTHTNLLPLYMLGQKMNILNWKLTKFFMFQNNFHHWFKACMYIIFLPAKVETVNKGEIGAFGSSKR